MYGHGGSYFGDYHFKPALEALNAGKTEFESIISDNGKILTIHRDDAADLFVRVAEAAPACRGEVFLAANPCTDNIRDILDAIVRITGLKGWKAREPQDGASLSLAWLTRSLRDGVDYPAFGSPIAWCCSHRLASQANGRI